VIRRAVIRFCLWRAASAEGRAAAALFVRVAIPAREHRLERLVALHGLIELQEDERRRAREWRALAEKVRAL
jgi:hypothetical protein